MPEMTQTPTNPQDAAWERAALEKVLMEGVKEQRRRRRWGIFFKLCYLALIIFIIAAIFTGRKITQPNRLKPHTALVGISGTIFDGMDNSADNVVSGLNEAFTDSKTVAVVLVINSPGGSPVQADYIYNNIIRLKKKYPNKKLYAVCSDICASAAYYVASAADDIYANPSSIVGSIGVLINGFGFVDTLNKLGIERRLLTAGSEKGFLDPFSPAKPQDNAYAQKMLAIVHQHFIRAVQEGRGNRLINDPSIFTGLAWTGDQAKDLGLIDGFGSPGFVVREIIRNTNIIDYTKKPGFLTSFTRDFSANFAHAFAEQFGLESGNRPLG
jgi:protease-4